jgi:hypothetical protein
MGKDVGTFLIAVVYLAALMVLVRPQSQGPTLVTNAANGVANVVKAGTGGGTW